MKTTLLIDPFSGASGDMLLAARKPSGGLHVMLGDFTGHGLSAAIGTVPVADIFYGMTDKGFSIGDILATINDKLRVILPTDVFFAAVLLELDANHSKLTLWNGGIPDVAIRRGDGRVETLPSDHLPLGVVENDQLDRAVRVVEVEPGDRRGVDALDVGEALSRPPHLVVLAVTVQTHDAIGLAGVARQITDRSTWAIAAQYALAWQPVQLFVLSALRAFFSCANQNRYCQTLSCVETRRSFETPCRCLGCWEPRW